MDQYLRYYTFGAYYSIKAIIEDLCCDSEEYVLLPAFLCLTIIKPFREAGIRYDFYKVKDGLLPDIEDIYLKSRKGLKAILFIDYFGFPQMEYLAETVKTLRLMGVLIIQDVVQAWIDNEQYLYGDYCFNSLRKYAPIEASVLFSKKKLAFNTNDKSIMRFIIHKRYAQLVRYLHLQFGVFNPEKFLKHFTIANEHYYQKGILKLPNVNRQLLDRLNFELMGKMRLIVYRELYTKLNLRLVVKNDSNIVPLGAAIYLDDRNEIKTKLHEMDIHCPIHWLLPDEIDKKEHEYSWDLQSHILTLPVNVKLSNLENYIDKLEEVL